MRKKILSFFFSKFQLKSKTQVKISYKDDDNQAFQIK
jgi:hypothetical protein